MDTTVSHFNANDPAHCDACFREATLTKLLQRYLEQHLRMMPYERALWGVSARGGVCRCPICNATRVAIGETV